MLDCCDEDASSCTLFFKPKTDTVTCAVAYIMHTCTHADNTCVHACMHSGMQPCRSETLHTCIPACLHTCMRTCVGTYIHTYIHACMHACMHACIHTHRGQTDRETGRQADRQAGTHMEMRGTHLGVPTRIKGFWGLDWGSPIAEDNPCVFTARKPLAQIAAKIPFAACYIWRG